MFRTDHKRPTYTADDLTERELVALRKVADAAKLYQNTVMEKRNLQLARNLTSREMHAAILDIGSAEFELSDALNLWDKMRHQSH